MKTAALIRKVKFDRRGLVPAIIQDEKSGRVLMQAYMNRRALEKTVETARTHFWSRSRKRLWMKGEVSGHTQKVCGIFLDCDGDTLLIKVRQTGAACHSGYYSCFYRRLDSKGRACRVVGRRPVGGSSGSVLGGGGAALAQLARSTIARTSETAVAVAITANPRRRTTASPEC